MSSFRYRNECNFCPWQPKPCKEMKRKLRNINYKYDSSKIPEHPFICNELEADKHAYEVCCKSKKRKKHLTLSQDEGLRKFKSPYARLCEIYRAPLPQKSFFVKKKLKWREERKESESLQKREKSLQEEARAEKEKYVAARWQNLVKKLEAQDEFQQLLEQTVRWRLEKEQVVGNPENNLHGQENPKKEDKRSKPTSEQIEKDLMKIFRKARSIRKDRKKVISLNTPLGKYEKRHNNKDAVRVRGLLTELHLPEKNVKKESAEKTRLQKQHQYGSFKFVPLPDPFDQVPKGKAAKVPLRESQKLPVRIMKLPTTNVGAKLSWNYRQAFKAKAMTKPKMSKNLDKLLKEKMSALKSRKKIPLERNLKKGKKEKVERTRNPSTKPHKSRLIDESDPNYGVYKPENSRHMPSGDIGPKFSKLFHKMLRGKEENIPELNEAVMSHHEILPNLKRRGKSSNRSLKKNKFEPTHGILKNSRTRHLMPTKKKVRLSDIGPKFSKQFHKMLRGKEENMPELNEALMSHHEIPDLKKAGISSDGSPNKRKHEPHKSRLKDESKPNYGFYKPEISRNMPSGDIGPKYTQLFHKRLRGKEETMPELNEALMSHHEILDLKTARKSSAGFPNKRKHEPYKSRLKDESETNYGVYKSENSRHMPSGDKGPKYTKQFHKMLRGKEENIPELNEAVMSHHKILPNLKRTGKFSNRSLKKNKFEPTHGVLKIGRTRHLMPTKKKVALSDIGPKFSKQFHKMLRGNEENMPELNETLMSHHEIPDLKRAGISSAGSPNKMKHEPHKSRLKDESEPNYGVYKPETPSHLPSGDKGPKYTKQFDKMLRGKEENMPELNEALMSHHEIPDLKTARKSYAGFPNKNTYEPHKSRLKEESKPNYGFYKPENSRHMPSGDKGPKYTKQFHKMLRGKEQNMPELNEALTSHHEIPDLKRAGMSSFGSPNKRKHEPHKSRLKDESEPNYGVYNPETPRHLPSGDIGPSFTKQFHKMLRGNEENMPELNEALMSHHEILPNLKRAVKPTVRSSRKSQFEPTYGVSKIGKVHHLIPSKKTVTLSEVNEKIFPAIEFHKNSSVASDDQYKSTSASSNLKPSASISSKLRNNKRKPINKSGRLNRLLQHHSNLKLKKFYSYIKNSKPDRSILERSGSKGAITYLSEKSSTNLMTEKSGPVKSSGSEDIAWSLLPGKKKEKEVHVERLDEDDFMLDTVSVDYRYSTFEKPLSEVIPSIANVEAKEKPKSKKEAAQVERKAEDDYMFYKVPEKYQNLNLKKRLSEVIPSIPKAEKAKKKPKSKKEAAQVERKAENYFMFDNVPGDSHYPTLKKTLSELIARIGKAGKAKIKKRNDDNDFMFNTMPEDYQNPTLKKSLSEPIASIPNAENAKKNSIYRPRESIFGLGNGRIRSLSLKLMRDEIKQFEHLRHSEERAQYQEEFVIEEKAAVQARIQQLMKYVKIREDYYPPKSPRDFIKENIEVLQKVQLRIKVEGKKKRKPKQKKPSSMQKPPDFSKSSNNFNQQLSDNECVCIRKQCCRSQDQQDHHQTKLKAPAEPVQREAQKCDTFEVQKSKC